MAEIEAWRAEAGQGEAEPLCGPDQGSLGNALLRSLPPTAYARLRPHLRRTRLNVGEVLAVAQEPIRTVCFLEGGVAGFLEVLDDGRRIAVGLVGREGVVGWPVLMGADRWPYEVRLRAVPAMALTVDAARVRELIAISTVARDLLLRFVGGFTAQMGRTIVSNLIQPVDRRTARWLLLYHDRLEGDEIALTHEELGFMLGVRRASVTDALHVLEGEGLIRSLRGRIVVRDRMRLTHWAGEACSEAEAGLDDRWA